MSQYFTYVNTDTQEVLSPSPSGPDALGHVTDPIGTGMLSYLLLSGEQDTDSTDSPYAGQWAADDVRLVGDYADNNLYYALSDTWRCRVVATETDAHPIGDTFSKTPPTRDAPIKQTPALYSGEYPRRRSHTVLDRDPECGDIAHIKHPESPYQKVYAEITAIETTDWTDITSAVRDEFSSLVSEDWIDAFATSARTIPNAVGGTNADGNPFIASGDQAAVIIEGADGYENMTVKQYIRNLDTTPTSDHDQYAFVNRQQSEYILPDTNNKATGLTAQLTNAVGTGMVAFLLLQGKQDGTRFSSLYDPANIGDKLANAIQEKMDNERERYKNEGRSSAYRNDDGSWDKNNLITAVAANFGIADERRYAGRWAGDGVTLIAKRDTPDLFTDITQGTRREFSLFAGSDWVANHKGSSIIRPSSKIR